MLWGDNSIVLFDVLFVIASTRDMYMEPHLDSDMLVIVFTTFHPFKNVSQLLTFCSTINNFYERRVLGIGKK